MFRHKGKNRTFKHNLRIASLLSFVAGVVNVAGFLAVQQLTTNVTGHFAFFVEEIYRLNAWRGIVYFLFVFFFFLGSFTSGLLIEWISRKNERFVFTIPVFIEIFLLLAVALSGNFLLENSPSVIAYILLFAMGLQNSLVTMVSNSVVRTTHLTGLFTDLGIELSQLFFYKESTQKKKLFSSIKLRLTIILYFFSGGVFSGVFYSSLGLYILFFPIVLLLTGLVYDQMKFRIVTLQRKLRHKNKKTPDDESGVL